MLACSSVIVVVVGRMRVKSANGDGERVGDAGGIGDGDGVRASGDSGMCPTDLRRLTAATVAGDGFMMLLLLLLLLGEPMAILLLLFLLLLLAEMRLLLLLLLGR